LANKYALKFMKKVWYEKENEDNSPRKELAQTLPKEGDRK
jgi:hypothetical protein